MAEPVGSTACVSVRPSRRVLGVDAEVRAPGLTERATDAEYVVAWSSRAGGDEPHTDHNTLRRTT